METRGGGGPSGLNTADFGGFKAELHSQLVRVYHEVRSPTALIATVARSALEVEDAGRARAALELIERIAGRALHRVAAVLDLASTDSVVPSERLREIVSDSRKCGSRIELTIDPRAAAAQIVHEASAFEALAQTLLDNAEAHGDPSCPIQVRLRQSRGGIRLTVTNATAHLSRHRGRGVGLPLALELARRMGGTLRTRPGAGKYVVQVSLPARVQIDDLVPEGAL